MHSPLEAITVSRGMWKAKQPTHDHQVVVNTNHKEAIMAKVPSAEKLANDDIARIDSEEVSPLAELAAWEIDGSASRLQLLTDRQITKVVQSIYAGNTFKSLELVMGHVNPDLPAFWWEQPRMIAVTFDGQSGPSAPIVVVRIDPYSWTYRPWVKTVDPKDSRPYEARFAEEFDRAISVVSEWEQRTGMSTGVLDGDDDWLRTDKGTFFQIRSSEKAMAHFFSEKGIRGIFPLTNDRLAMVGYHKTTIAEWQERHARLTTLIQHVRRQYEAIDAAKAFGIDIEALDLEFKRNDTPSHEDF